MKAFTDINQSKKLAEILPLESADMYYWCGEDLRIGGHRAMDIDYDIPCWSLAALLDVLPDTMLGKDKDGYVVMAETMGSGQTTFASNSIDACVEMIIKLKEQNLL